MVVVVQSRRKEEGKERKYPQQFTRVAGADLAIDPAKSLMGVYQLHNSHGGQQKEKKFGDRFKTAREVLLIYRNPQLPHNGQHPKAHPCKERHARLVYLNNVFEGDQQIPDRENNQGQCRSHYISLCRFSGGRPNGRLRSCYP